MPRTSDAAARKLAEIYRAAYQIILERLAQAIRDGRSTEFDRTLLNQIQTILDGLNAETRRWADEELPKRFRDAWAEVEAFMRKDPELRLKLQTTMVKVHEDAVRVIAENLVFDLGTANAHVLAQVKGFIGRRADDLLRQLGLAAVGRKLTTMTPWQVAKADLLHDLLDEGLTAFVDKAGRRWNLPAYAAMAIRTVTREAVTSGTLDAMERYGLDLVQVSWHTPTCHICAGLQKKVYSLTGKTSGYPVLPRKTPFHPNCRHVLTPYNPKFDPNADATRAYSQRPWDEDPRTRAEVEAYDRQQAMNVIRRERRQIAAQLAQKVVPLNKDMQRWAEELKRSDLDPARRRELKQKMQYAAERWEQGRRERYRELGGRLKALKAAEGKAPRPAKTKDKGWYNNRTQSIIKSEQTDREMRKQLRPLRRSELAGMPPGAIEETLNRAKGSKPLNKPTSHYKKHAHSMGFPKSENPTPDMVSSFREHLSRIRNAPDEVFTFRHVTSGERQWAFVQRQPTGRIHVVIWDEDKDQDVTAWGYGTNAELKEDLLKKLWVKVR